MLVATSTEEQSMWSFLECVLSIGVEAGGVAGLLRLLTGSSAGRVGGDLQTWQALTRRLSEQESEPEDNYGPPSPWPIRLALAPLACNVIGCSVSWEWELEACSVECNMQPNKWNFKVIRIKSAPFKKKKPQKHQKKWQMVMMTPQYNCKPSYYCNLIKNICYCNLNFCGLRWRWPLGLLKGIMNCKVKVLFLFKLYLNPIGFNSYYH